MYKNGGTISVFSEKKKVERNIGFQVSSCYNLEEPRQLIEGALYRVRMYHPAIDGIGKLKTNTGSLCLVFVQISKVPYSSHKSKIEDVVENRYGNKTYKQLNQQYQSILSFYLQLCGSPIKCHRF